MFSHPALFSGQEAAWTKLLSFSCTEELRQCHVVSPRMQEERLFSKGTHHPTCPGGFTNLKANQKTSESPQAAMAKARVMLPAPLGEKGSFQGCFYGHKLFMLGACKMVMLNQSLLQPAEGKAVFRGDLPGLLQIMS